MADSAVVGILRALLTADTAQFDVGMRKAAATSKATERAIGGLGSEVKKLTPQAERMVKAFQGDKLLHQANNLVAAVTKIGGAQKLTAAEQASVNRTLDAALTKYKALGQTAPKAMVDLAKATSGAAGPTQFLTTKMVALGAAAGTFFAQLAGQSIRTLIQFGKEALDSAGTLIDLSAKTGLSTDALQRMEFVAQQTGTSLDAFTNAAFKLGVKLAGGGDSVKAAVEKLGIAWEDLKKASPDKQFEIVITALGKMRDADERNRLGVELFGRVFASISASVAQNYEEIAKAAQLSSRAQLEAMDVAGDRWDQFVKNSKTGLRSFMGDILLAGDELQRSSFWEALGKLAMISVGSSLPDAPRILANLRTRQVQADAKSKAAADEQAKAREQQTKKEIDYVAALKEAQGELTKLSAAERKQIAAAKELGVAQDDLEELVVKFGGSSKNAETILNLLSDATKKSGKTAKDAGKEWQTFIDRFTGAETMETALNLGKAIGTSQINLAKLTKEQQEAIAKALEEGAEAWKAWGGTVPTQIDRAIAAINKFKHSVLELPGLTPDGKGFKSLLALPEPSIEDLGDQLAQFERPARVQEDAARAHAKVLRDLDISRTEAAIRQAEREGVKKAQLLQMESILAQKKRDADLADAQDAFAREVEALQKTSGSYQQEYDAREQVYADHVRQINETWAQGQAEREDMIRRESSFWASELGKQISGELKGINQELTGKLFSTFFGGTDGESKKRAEEARDEYKRIAASGKASAEEITRAFRAMRQAEEDAHTKWADRFKGMWDGIKRHLFNIFDEILGAFVNRLLKGMLKQLAATKLGGKLMNLIGLGGGEGGSGGLLGTGASALGGLLGGGAGSVGTLAGAPILGANGAVIGTVSATGGTTAAGATAAASGGVGGGTGAAIGALATNPITIAAAGVLALWASGALSAGKFGKEQIEQWRQGKAGQTDRIGRLTRGNFDPRFNIDTGQLNAAALMPAMPSSNQNIFDRLAAAKMVQPSGAGAVVSMARGHTIQVNVNTLDAADFNKIIDGKLIPRLKFMINTNESQMRSVVKDAALS